MIRSTIQSCGAYLPQKVMTNHDLEKIVDTSDEWIYQRTGIRERRIAEDHELTSDMAIKAAQQALLNGNFTPSDIDCIIVATSTPDHTFPAVATKVQAALGAPIGPAFDIQAVCSGFVYGMSVSDSLIVSGQAKRVLLIGAEKFSSILDWDDRTTCVLFGDGAGAIVLEADDTGKGSLEDRGILSTHIYAKGDLNDILYVNGGPASTQTSGVVVMDGKEVFKNAVKYMSEVVNEVLDKNNISADQIDWLVPHQANIRIIEATAKKLGLSMDKVIVTVSKHGNTSAASVPLALAEAVNSNVIKRNDMILFEALGAGLTWGAILARF